MVLNEFVDVAVKHGLAQSKHNLQQYLSVLFDGVDFRGKSFLDIGGGTGLFTHYAAHQGASRALCLEPEDDGSTAGVTDIFNAVNSELNHSETAELDRRLFQDYSGNPFDIVLLHNAVNHLDERACIDLLESQDAQEIYLGLFEKLGQLMSPNGILIMCDCGRRNFFSDLGLTNPVMSTIEWEKHQQPEVWGELLEKSGFTVERIKWNTFNSLGRFGPLLLGYFLPSYFTLSHFRLYARKSA